MHCKQMTEKKTQITEAIPLRKYIFYMCESE